MLNNLAQSEYSVARLAPASARQEKVLRPAQDLLRPVMQLLDSGQIHLSGESDQHRLQGIRQQVINCTTETHAGLLSQYLRALGKKLLNDPSFASVGETILQVVIQAKLPDWKHAQHALQLHLGISGSLFEQVGKTLHGLSETKTLAPMVVAMAGAGLVGRGVKLLGTQLFKNTSFMAKAGEWAVHSAASGAGLIAEAAVFPAMHAGGALLVNQPVHLDHYLSQAYHGLTLMGSLRVAGAAAKYTLHGLHGIQLANIQLANSASGATLPMATRLRSLTSWTRLTLPATYELGALTYLNTKDHPQQSFAANFAGAIGLALEFRLAGSLLQTLAPGITAANRALEFKSIQALKTNGLRLANSFSQKLKDLLSGPGTGSGWRSGSHTGLTEALAGVGMGNGLRPDFWQTNETQKQQRDLLEARLQGESPGNIGGPEPSKFSQAVREGLEIPENFFPSLQNAMKKSGASRLSPLTDRRWKDYQRVVDGVVANKMHPHDGLYHMIKIVHADLIEKIFYHRLQVPGVYPSNGKITDSPVVDQNYKKYVPETMRQIKRDTIPINFANGERHSLTLDSVAFLDDFRNATNLLLLHQKNRTAPFSFISPVGGRLNLCQYFHFPNPIDYLEWYFNQQPWKTLPYESVSPKYWITHSFGESKGEKIRLDQYRFMLVSPFGKDTIHLVPELGASLRKNITKDTHPMLVLIHDIAHGVELSLFPLKVARDQEMRTHFFAKVGGAVDNEELSNNLAIISYDLGGAELDTLEGPKSFTEAFIAQMILANIAARKSRREGEYQAEFVRLIQEGFNNPSSEKKFYERLWKHFAAAKMLIGDL